MSYQFTPIFPGILNGCIYVDVGKQSSTSDLGSRYHVVTPNKTAEINSKLCWKPENTENAVWTWWRRKFKGVIKIFWICGFRSDSRLGAQFCIIVHNNASNKTRIWRGIRVRWLQKPENSWFFGWNHAPRLMLWRHLYMVYQFHCIMEAVSHKPLAALTGTASRDCSHANYKTSQCRMMPLS